MESAVKKRLIEYLNYKDIGQNKFALSCGLSSGFVSNITVSIKLSTLLRISKHYPDLNTTWILTGEGEMILKDDEEMDTKSIVSDHLPVYHRKKTEFTYKELEEINHLQSELVKELRDRVKFQAELINELLSKIK